MTLTTVNPALLDTQAQYTGFKNRIINGAMVIDQRNAGASVSISGVVNQYTLDRWNIRNDAEAIVSVQQSSIAPNGFNNSLIYTVTTADTSLGATQRYLIQQRVEGFNCADFGWGGANAQTVTLSFWVRSSLTGTFGGSFGNSGGTRSYPFTYSISAANTWEQKTITIAGDTSGTWLTTNGIGLAVTWSMGSGSSNSGTAGAWAGAEYTSATGATSVVGTNGATFYITGVQLEKGSTATSFDYRPYGTELALCQRYYYLHAKGVFPSSSIGTGCYITAAQLLVTVQFPATMRANPTLVVATGTSYYDFYRNGASDPVNSFVIDQASTTIAAIINTTEASGTAGQAGIVYAQNASASVAFSSEL